MRVQHLSKLQMIHRAFFLTQHVAVGMFVSVGPVLCFHDWALARLFCS